MYRGETNEAPLLLKGASMHGLGEGAGRRQIDWPALFSILCTMAGTGILQLPLTAKQGGWSCVSLILIVAMMANTTGRWLIRCLYVGGKDAKMSGGYPAIGFRAFGRGGKIIVHIFHKATLLGVTTIFLILSGKFLLEGIGGSGNEGLMKFGHEDENGRSPWGARFTIISACAVAVPVVCFRSIGEIAPLAAFGLAASMLCVFEIVAYSFVLGRVNQDVVDDYDLPVPDDFAFSHANGTAVQYHFFDASGFSSAFAAITLSFGGHAVFPSIESDMRRPERFDATFNLSFVCLVAMYLACSISGYYTFGDIVYSPVLCNFSRDRSSAMGILTACTKLIIAGHVMSAYPLLLVTAATEIETSLGLNGEKRERDDDEEEALFVAGGDETHLAGVSDAEAKRHCVYRTLLRLGLVVFTCLVAVFVPYFPQVMELVGAMCLCMIVFVLPVVFYWKLFGHSMSLTQKIWGVCIVAAGVAGGSIGSVQAISDIVSKLKSGDPY